MNKLLSISQLKERLNMSGRENRYVVDLLRHVAEQRSSSFQLIRLGRRFFVTEEDIKRLLPELHEHEARDEDSLRYLIEKQAIELREQRKRIEALENALWAARRNAA